MSSAPIVIFDSGIGGLTVVHAIRQILPLENIIYLGDTARVPYGTKSATTIERYALQAGEALKKFHPKLMIVACNTASAYGLDLLRSQCDFPVLGVIESGAKAAHIQGGPIAILGTRATVASHAYPRILHQLDALLEDFQSSVSTFSVISRRRLVGRSDHRSYLSPLYFGYSFTY